MLRLLCLGCSALTLTLLAQARQPGEERGPKPQEPESRVPASAAPNNSVSTISEAYVASTPAAELFAQPPKEFITNPPLPDTPIHWKLMLTRNTGEPDSYVAHGEYLTQGSKSASFECRGKWFITQAKSRSNAPKIFHELSGAFTLLQIDENILHVVTSDRMLKLGNGGYSFSFNRESAAEKALDPSIMAGRRSLSYKIDPPESGPNVFGVFEGRTPYAGISKQLGVAHAVSLKAKWRVTLRQDPITHAPSTYKVEGTLQRVAQRHGVWSVDSEGVITLKPATADEQPICLLRIDDNVLFFLDANQEPLVGSSEFSYTLNRRAAAPSR